MAGGVVDERVAVRPVVDGRTGRRACAAWLERARGQALPRLDEAAFGPDDRLLFLADGEPADGLARLLREQAAAIGRATGPLRFRADTGNGGAAGWSGLLLPYADAVGRVVAVAVVAERHAVPSPDERRRLADAVAAASGRPDGNPPRNPWGPEPLAPPSAAESRAEARTWAALAEASPACRAVALDRAARAAQAAGRTADGDASPSPGERAGPARSAATLDADPDGMRAADAGAAATSADPAGRLELAPLDLAFLARRRREPALFTALAA